MNEQIDFYQIYNDHVKMVYNLCLNYLQNTEDAEEATQDVFVKVHDNLSKFKGESTLKTWVYKISIRHCLDLIKSKKRQKRFGFMQSLFGKTGNEIVELTNFNHPGIELENKQAVKTIMSAINSLPENQKTAIILKSIEGLKGKEIAEIMLISEKAVESLLSRAKQNLKEKLNTNEGN